MALLLKILWLFLGVIALTIITLIVGSLLSLDWGKRHSQQTEKLPDFDGKRTGLVLIETPAGKFRARVAGLTNSGPNLVLLHGFPESSVMWQPLIDAAVAQGYRVIAFDQRGYSPGVRPTEKADYVIENLINDLFAVADSVGFAKFHLVAHDWGSAIGWVATSQAPERIETYTSLSIPHIQAFGEAIQNDPEQQKKSSYIGFFVTPYLPEWVFTWGGMRAMKRLLYVDHPAEEVEEYLNIFSEPGALTAALNWYRATALTAQANASEQTLPKVVTPILFIWGNQDPAVSRVGVEAQEAYIGGPLTTIELDAGHWLIQDKPETICAAVLSHLKRYSPLSKQEL